ncbi:hypothetical protein D3C72_2090990 [compost metagenome]
MQADRPAAGQAWMTKVQVPAKVTVARRGFIHVKDVVANILDVAVQLFKVTAQCRQAIHLMQGITKLHVVAVELPQPVQAISVQRGVRVSEMAEIGRHDRLQAKLYNSKKLYRFI